jgi:pimeloyl-ACP methyl ester carboxylesterase
VKQINAGVLSVGYVELGPANGRPVILLHGFPYDIHSYVEVAPLLAAEGYPQGGHWSVSSAGSDERTRGRP